ncbi:MAG: hypothetical protein ABFD50_08905, partial [Smithella sp.]
MERQQRCHLIAKRIGYENNRPFFLPEEKLIEEILLLQCQIARNAAAVPLLIPDGDQVFKELISIDILDQFRKGIQAEPYYQFYQRNTRSDGNANNLV